MIINNLVTQYLKEGQRTLRIILLLILFSIVNMFAQNQSNIWYCGNGLGLDFNENCDPIVRTDGSLFGNEGCATISDKTTGELLFYTNSEAVWDANHDLMENGDMIPFGRSTTQVMIIQKPDFDSIYYIITADKKASGDGYLLHEIDMSLNNGLGGIAFKDSLFFPSPCTEKITAIKHENGIDIWLIGHQFSTNAFMAFLVTNAGIAPAVYSLIGKAHNDSIDDAIGEMKASPNGEKLAVVTYVSPNIELFDFNNATGEISNLITLTELGGFLSGFSLLYGLSFSSDNSKLYASVGISDDTPAKIIQYDISSNDSITINASRVDVFTTDTTNIGSLKLGPNRKIYVAKPSSSGGFNEYLGIINSPDSSGLQCNYIDKGLYCNGKYAFFGLNNSIEHDEFCDVVTGNTNIENHQNITFAPNPFNERTILKADVAIKNAQLLLFDNSGKLLRSYKSLNGYQFEVLRGELTSGLYFYSLTESNKLIQSEKFIIID